MQQGDVSSTEPPLPESSTNGGQPEISAYFEAVEHYISSAGWVLLEINAEGIIECVSENIKELIQFTRQDLHNQSIYTYLHPGDHKILSPILNNMTFSQGWESLDDVDGPGGPAKNNDSNNNSLTGESSCFGASGGPGSGGASAGNTNGGGQGSNTSVAVVGGQGNGSSSSATNNSSASGANNSTAGLSPKRSIRSRIRMLLKHADQETVEQKQRRQDKYEEVVIIAAPVRDGDECSSVLCLITRPEDENLGEGTVHSQVQHLHNQHINAQQPPQLLQANLEQLTLKLAPTGKILSCNMTTLRESFQKHLAKEPASNLMDLCHYQDQPLLQKHLHDVLLSSGPHHATYRLRLGAPDIYMHCKTQSKVFQGAAPPAGDGDFIMAVHTILHDSDIVQNNLMGGQQQQQQHQQLQQGSSSSNNVNNSSSSTSTISGILMSPGSMSASNSQQMQMQGGPSGMMQMAGVGGGLPNYFQQQQQQQNKMLSNGGGGGMMNNNNNSGSHGLGGPLMTSVINGGGGSAQQQQQLQNRMKQDYPMLDLDLLTESTFDFAMDDFNTSPMSRTSLTPVNNSRPPSVSATYSPLPTPLTPFHMHQPNSAVGDPMQASPNGGGGRHTPNTQTSGYGSTAGGSSFSFAGFGGDDSQGSSSTGKEKTGMAAMSNRQAQQQQQMMETTRLRTLLSNPQNVQPGGSNTAVSPPSGCMGPKKGGGAKKGAGGDSRQSNQILKVSTACTLLSSVLSLSV